MTLLRENYSGKWAGKRQSTESSGLSGKPTAINRSPGRVMKSLNRFCNGYVPTNCGRFKSGIGGKVQPEIFR